MNATNMLLKVYNMLGLKFSEEKFAMLKLRDGGVTITNNSEDPLALEQEIFVVGENSELQPGPSGEHILEDGTMIVLDENSRIVKIGKVEDVSMEEVEGESEPVVEVEESEEEVKDLSEEMTRAEATDGKIIESNTFDVGEPIYQVDGDETKPLPDGEYEISLKDESGNENKMKLFVKDGVITERENVETMAAVPSEMDMMKEEMANMKMAIQEMLGYLKTRDEEMSVELSQVKKDFETFRKSPASTPVRVEKNVKQTFEDWRYEQLKKIRN